MRREGAFSALCFLPSARRLTTTSQAWAKEFRGALRYRLEGDGDFIGQSFKLHDAVRCFHVLLLSALCDPAALPGWRHYRLQSKRQIVKLRIGVTRALESNASHVRGHHPHFRGLALRLILMGGDVVGDPQVSPIHPLLERIEQRQKDGLLERPHVLEAPVWGNALHAVD